MAVASGMHASPRSGRDMLRADIQDRASCQVLRRGPPTELQCAVSSCKASRGRPWPQRHQLGRPQAPLWKPISPAGCSSRGQSTGQALRWRLSHRKEIFPVGIRWTNCATLSDFLRKPTGALMSESSQGAGRALRAGQEQ